MNLIPRGIIRPVARHLIGPNEQPTTIIMLVELNIKPIPNDVSLNPHTNTSFSTHHRSLFL